MRVLERDTREAGGEPEPQEKPPNGTKNNPHTHHTPPTPDIAERHTHHTPPTPNQTPTPKIHTRDTGGVREVVWHPKEKF